MAVRCLDASQRVEQELRVVVFAGNVVVPERDARRGRSFWESFEKNDFFRFDSKPSGIQVYH